MQTQMLTCASCGATLRVPPDLDRINCAHCGTALHVVRGEGYVASSWPQRLAMGLFRRLPRLCQRFARLHEYIVTSARKPLTR